MLVALLLIAWWLSGFLSFVYWYRFDADVTTEELPLACGAGILGPVAFVMGCFIHGYRERKALFRRKQK